MVVGKAVAKNFGEEVFDFLVVGGATLGFFQLYIFEADPLQAAQVRKTLLENFLGVGDNCFVGGFSKNEVVFEFAVFGIGVKLGKCCLECFYLAANGARKHFDIADTGGIERDDAHALGGGFGK